MVHSSYRSKIILALAVSGFLGLANHATAATLSLTPPTGSYPLGAPFTTTVMVGSGGVALNAVSGVIAFPKDKLEVVSLGKASSVITYWVREPSYSNLTGRVEFEGVIPNPGFSGLAGRILTVTFRPKIVGVASLDWAEGAVLANDGEGTNILSGLAGARYVIVPVKLKSPASEATTALGAPSAPQVTSPTHPDSTLWYRDPDPTFKWELASEITGVNILADHSPSTNPGTISDGRFATYSYQAVKDGTWYFHLRLRNAGGWGDITHFGFKVDTVPPTDLKLIPLEQPDSTAPEVAFTITALDSGSGVDRYELSIDGDAPSLWSDNEAHQFISPKLKPGQHTLLAKVYDRAGNMLAGSIDFSIAPLPPPRILEYPREVSIGDTLTLRGEASPGIGVTMRFKQPDKSEVIRETRADQAGRFVIAIDEKWPVGVYLASAIAHDDRGAESLSSEVVSFSIYLPIFWQWGNNLLRWLSLIVPILALIILLILVILWSYYRVIRLKRKVRRESREAVDALHKAFDFLREKSRDQLALLETAKASRVLTKEETALAESLRQSLNDVEAFVRKEIGDIERTVD